MADDRCDLSEEGFDQEAAGIGLAQAPAAEIEERRFVERPGRRPMGAFDVVGVNLKLRLHIHLGQRREEQVIGKRSAEIVPPAIWPGVLENYRKAIRLKQVIEWEEVIAEPIGNRAGIVSIAPVFINKLFFWV